MSQQTDAGQIDRRAMREQAERAIEFARFENWADSFLVAKHVPALLDLTDTLVERLRTTRDRCSCTVPPYCDDCAADLALLASLGEDA